jgi:hypothetical protein
MARIHTTNMSQTDDNMQRRDNIPYLLCDEKAMEKASAPAVASSRSDALLISKPVKSWIIVW